MENVELKKLTVALSLIISAIGSASAHTTSLGYVPGENAGEVTLWAGHYDHGGLPSTEGTGLLTGVSLSYSSGVLPFDLGPVASKPSGLIDGINNFFWTISNGNFVFGSGIDPSLAGPVVHWEGITFTGLTPGIYDFTIADDSRTTQEWQNLSSGSVRITLSGQDIGGGDNGTVPEPTTIALFGLGLLGFAATRRKKSA